MTVIPGTVAPLHSSGKVEDDRPVGVAELRETIRRLERARRRLILRPVDSIVAVLDEAVQGWLRPDSRWRKAAESLLPAATGFSPAMIRFALPFMIEPLRAPHLGNLLDAEFGSRSVLDRTLAANEEGGPGIIAHLLSGNLPALAAIPAALSLAIKSAALIKPARGDRVFPFLFAESITALDADLGTCVAPCYWRGGDRTAEDIVFAAADLVVAFGDDATIAELGARRKGPFVGHGHKVSLAVVSDDLPDEELATAAVALALDVAVWDQRGCLSPQVCLVVGDLGRARGFAERVNTCLADLAGRLPPGETSVEEKVAVRRFREEAEWRAFGGTAVTLFTAGDWADGTVVVDPEPAFRPTPLCRSLLVFPVRDGNHVRQILKPARSLLEAAGIAVAPQRETAWTEILHEAGVGLVSPLGQMQRPPLAWRQGGRPRVGEWILRTIDEA